MEALTSKGYEVLFLTEAVDELVALNLQVQRIGKRERGPAVACCAVLREAGDPLPCP